MSAFSRAAILLLTFCLSWTSALASDRALSPQYVIISFDGALHNSQWERSRALARQTGADFTYFLSCVYLLSPETRHLYRGPGMKPGRTNVGSGYSREDVAERLRQIWAARLEGHEIASHACGHFDGKDWSKAMWLQEFDQFDRILRDAWTINDIPFEPKGWRQFAAKEIQGFRVPYLSAGPGLYEALAERGFVYEAGSVSQGPVMPAAKGGVMRFSLPLIPEGAKGRPVIAMDYNFFARHSGAKEKPERSAEFEERAYAAFHAAFDRQFSGKRLPLQIGFHFTLMNDGAYWRALERFAREVCVRGEVRCVSYRQYIEETPPAAGNAGNL
ncbi:hypothetical protein L598_000800000610 [Mesorhizobium sp. J18]|uniref:polysaccharide deacetylase n=1 Tax=Mesorhizobium sp. J18 TaxID=935263 RepID=UPI00119B93D9|nr:polysaccharide deacetylase [Mesorhizobium sp. J18]TWG89597.1 hypothetical protein L598_000800000610 [Mesorhizobium sp. J18]